MHEVHEYVLVFHHETQNYVIKLGSHDSYLLKSDFDVVYKLPQNNNGVGFLGGQ